VCCLCVIVEGRLSVLERETKGFLSIPHKGSHVGEQGGQLPGVQNNFSHICTLFVFALLNCKKLNKKYSH
jgi:hypothetical protein